jgi:pentapeptide repeat protein
MDPNLKRRALISRWKYEEGQKRISEVINALHKKMPIPPPPDPAGLIGQEQSPQEGPDLRCIDLSGQNLDGVDLTKARLQGANLARSSLRNAKLVQADLRDALLRNTDFTNADLRGAIMAGAILENTRFDGANLTDAVVTKKTIIAGTTNLAEGVRSQDQSLRPLISPEPVED